MLIRQDDLTGSEIIALLNEHLEDMYRTSPPESVHALDLDALRQPEITFWTLWVDNQLAGCVAVKVLADGHGEIKSMRTANIFRGKGIGNLLMQHLLTEAEQKGLTRLSLETGSMAFFEPARKLYEKFGFSYCPPFGNYQDDPNSVFMTRIV